MERKLKERSLDIRSEMFDPLWDELQGQLIDCIKAIETGAVDSGDITAKLSISLSEKIRDVVCDAEGRIENRPMVYKKPVIDYSTKLMLKKEDSQKGKIEEDSEIVCVNDRWVLREVERQQLSIDAIEEPVEDITPEESQDEQQ